jgi:oligopeptide/dipeptide ABC transporter ATP-binding protein
MTLRVNPATAPKILEVEKLQVNYPITGGVFARRVGEVRAVEDVNFTLRQGETLGLVGESGCGKSTVGRAIVNILRAMVYGVQVSGRVLYYPREATSSNRDAGTPVDLAALSRHDMRPYRPDLQMIFQDPYSSLNPRMTVGQIVEEPLTIHAKLSRAERAERVGWLLEKVGLTREQSTRYPHEFSGGQRQRIGIARALATRPRIVIADEPVSALDVSIQAQVINLMQDLQDEFGLSYLFIAHDLSVVRHISDRIAVMYLGHIVELGPSASVYKSPVHPYSRALLSAVPRPDPDARLSERIHLGGEVPSPINKPSGCPFRTRCPIAKESCALAMPALEPKGDHLVACPHV